MLGSVSMESTDHGLQTLELFLPILSVHRHFLLWLFAKQDNITTACIAITVLGIKNNLGMILVIPEEVPRLKHCTTFYKGLECGPGDLKRGRVVSRILREKYIGVTQSRQPSPAHASRPVVLSSHLPPILPVLCIT